MSKGLTAGIVIFVAALFAIFISWKPTMQNRSRILKIALQGEIPAGQLSPENISTVALYHLHYNLWDTLLTTGQSSAVAKSFRVSPDNLSVSFEIDPNAKFSNGRTITANDIKAAFERIMAREENGHINAKSVIQKITAVSPTELKIELSAPTPSFLFLLTTPEFAIIPVEALDIAGNVTNLSVTSGPYTVEKADSMTQTIHLTRNKFFRRSVDGAPERVEISFIKDLGATTTLADFDFVEVSSSDAENTVSGAEKQGYTYKVTVPSISIFLVADTNQLSPDQAKYIAQAFRDHFQFGTSHGFEKRSHQFFPEKTFGSLSPNEIPAINIPKHAPKLPAEIVISNNRSTGPLVDAVTSVFSKVGAKVRFVNLASKEPVHYMLVGQGMNTDFPEIELHLDTVGPYADFNATNEIKHLVNQATHEASDEKRSEIIKKIGTEFLSSGKIVPLTVRAYVHLFRASRVDLNNITNYDGDIPFYRLKVLE